MKKYILALDQGTTSSRAIVFDHRGSPIATAQKEFAQFFPRPGWVEHNPDEIWSTQAGVAIEAVARAGLESSQIAGTGITNQRETTVIWNRKTGRAIYNAIVWQDRRTSNYCDQLRRSGIDKIILEKTGLIVDAYFSATKIRWILDNVSGARASADRGELAFGTVDAWLIWNLTGGKLHITDVSNASRTMLFNIHTMEWDADLLRIFDVPGSMLPVVRSSSEVYGLTAGLLTNRVPVSGIAGDQQAALFGQMCIEEGMVKNTYGTGCFMMMNTGTAPIVSRNRLITTIAWKIGDKTEYALEGSIFIGGAVVQWLRDSLGIIASSSEVEKLAAQAEGSEGVYFVPAFTGLGAPYWNQHVRGSLFGLTRGSTASHIARAALDSIAYQTLDVLIAMQNDSNMIIKELRVDGGATVNNCLMQFQSDILQANVVRPRISETTALGAAYLAGLAVGYWNGTDEIRRQWQADKIFTPAMKPEETRSIVGDWHRAVKAAEFWAEQR
jgi:glycerol kinase